MSDNESSDNGRIWLDCEGEASLYGRDFFLNWFDDEQLFDNEDDEEEVVDDKSLIGDDGVPAAFDFEWRPIYKINVIWVNKSPWSE